jgi:hypothetical protein
VASAKVICLTPVKNEAWILERFLKCASLWADHIIIADQGSEDNSREIARGFSKVTLIDNPSPVFNEPERQKLLIDAARQIPGPRLLLALDADEFLTANCLHSPEWQTVLNAPAGTVIRFEWPIILADVCSYWTYPYQFAFGFMDDGSDHHGLTMHSPRVPVPPDAPEIILKTIRVMHYAFTDLERAKSKLRWYQCWETLNRPERRPSDIYRFNHKDLNVPLHAIKTMPDVWTAAYEAQGIDMRSVRREAIYRWDREILELFAKHGTERFKKLDIWNVNWAEIYKIVHQNGGDPGICDPRGYPQRAVHRWLRLVQPYYSHFSPTQPIYLRLPFRLINNLLRIAGW